MDWRGRKVNDERSGEQFVNGDAKGFWNSCSVDVRQQLIDSKARMHVADNLRKERESLDRIEQLDSPEAAVKTVLKLVKIAEDCAKKQNDFVVAGWAKTVATSYSESIAKSVPSTVPSFQSYSDGLKSSESSVPIEEFELKEQEVCHLRAIIDRQDKEMQEQSKKEKKK